MKRMVLFLYLERNLFDTYYPIKPCPKFGILVYVRCYLTEVYAVRIQRLQDVVEEPSLTANVKDGRFMSREEVHEVTPTKSFVNDVLHSESIIPNQSVVEY